MTTQQEMPSTPVGVAHTEICHRCDVEPVTGHGVLCAGCRAVEDDTLRALMRKYN